MTPIETTIILFSLLLILLFFNVPLMVAIGLPTAIVMIFSGMNPATLAQRMFSSADAFTLMAIPFFMFAGKLMEVGGMSKRIVRFANCLVGWMTGGLAHVIVLASAFFGALSGSAAATCAAIGSTLIPDMKKQGYPADMVAGLQAVAGGLGIIIPPSISMIVYGVCSNTSIGKLFMGGILPGILIAVFLMTTVYFQSKKRGIKQTGTFTFRELGVSFLDAIPALMVPIIILGGIYGGIFSPTEAGAIAALYAFLVGTLWYREVGRNNLADILTGSITNTVLVMLTVSISGAFSWLLTCNGVSALLSNAIGTIAINRTVFLLLANLILIFVGMFIETCAGILIVTPILFPVAMQLGIDPVHFGVIVSVNLAMGLSTPPVGENQYIAAAIAEVPFEDELKSAAPFLLANFLALVVITYVPQLSTWLPNFIQ